MNNTNDVVSVIKSILDYHISTNTDGEYGYIHNEKSNFENIFGYKDRFIIENMSDDLDFYGSIFIRKDFFGHNYEIVFRTANLRIFEEMGCSVILYKYAKRVIAEEKDSLGLELKKLSDMKHYENDSVLDKHDDGKDIWFDEIVSVSDILDLKKKVINFIYFNEALAMAYTDFVETGNFMGSDNFLLKYRELIYINNIEV